MFSTFITELIQITTPSKYRDIYVSICQRGAERGTNRKQLKESLGYVEGHHFIPKCITKEYATEQHNIVFLTAREHFICHYLLCKIFKQTEHYFSLLSAFGKMSNIAPSMKHNRYMNSHLYEHFRKNVSSLMKNLRKDKIRVKMGNVTREIHKDVLKTFLDIGWKIGAASTESAKISRALANKKRAGNVVCMHFPGDVTYVQVLKDDIQEMIQKGAVLGKVFSSESKKQMAEKQRIAKTGMKAITNGITTKRVSDVEFNKLINQGWRPGIHHEQQNRGGFIRPGTAFFNDGIKNYRMLPEEADKRGLERGRLKISRCNLSTTQS
jgi:hypothetical protein